MEPLFQVKARLRKKTAVVAARDEVRALVDDAKQHARIYLPFNYNRARSGNMLEISIPDLHVAKYAWAR